MELAEKAIQQYVADGINNYLLRSGYDEKQLLQEMTWVLYCIWGGISKRHYHICPVKE